MTGELALAPGAALVGEAPPESRERRRLLGALFVATVCPMVLMPLLARFHPFSGGITGIRNLLIFLGGSGHVALTAFFYTEGELRALFRVHPLRYLVVPSVLVLGTGATYQALGTPHAAHILLAYFAWQTYHYMRQNYGVLAFVGLATASGPPVWLERVVLNLGVFAGILGMVRLMSLQANTVLDGYEGLLYETGLFAYIFVPLFAAAALVAYPRIARSPTRVLFLFLAAVFYLPTFLFEDMASAISSYAFAHGLQYFIFMYYVGRKGGAPEAWRRLASLAALCLLVGGLLTFMSDRTLWGRADFVFGCYLGLVMTHFVVDAGVWRLGEAFQRAYLSQSFGFLLPRR